MIDFQKQILAEIAKRKMTLNEVARKAEIDTPRIYALRDGKPITSKTLEKILTFLSGELKFKK